MDNTPNRVDYDLIRARAHRLRREAIAAFLRRAARWLAGLPPFGDTIWRQSDRSTRTRGRAQVEITRGSKARS